MNEKLQESILYLKYCSTIENEAFKLYETLSKKINQPESALILGLAYDSLKNAKVIQDIVNNFDETELESKNAKKDLVELASETDLLTKKISKINSLDYLTSCGMLKESANLEDLLGEVYTNYLQSSACKILVEELSKLVTVSLSNFKKVFENFVEEKARHRGTVVETIYALEAKETETHRQITPIVKYQNPDAWIRESTIHSFAAAPSGNTQT